MLDMHSKPSELMGIEDAYTAFCFNEACAFILKQIQDGNEPIITEGLDTYGNKREYSKPSDMYSKYK